MKSDRGFTLIEVLVALVIVALGMGAALKALSSAADSTMRLREKTFAAWVGFNQLATERLRPGAALTGSRQGDADLAGLRWHWQQTIEDMELPGLKRITIRVRHADDGSTAGGGRKAAPAREEWLATVVGFRGDALQFPQSELPAWDDASGAAQPPGAGAGPGSGPGSAPVPAPGPAPAPAP